MANMKIDLVIGLLGLWIVLLAFLWLPVFAVKALMIASGLAVAFISFRSIARRKLEMQLSKSQKSQEIGSSGQTPAPEQVGESH